MWSLTLVWMLSLNVSLPTAATGAALGSSASDEPPADGQNHAVVWVQSDEEAPAGSGHRMILHKLGDDDDAAASNIQAGGPWLGIQFGPISKPLAAQLKIDAGVGQMVLNVAEGSPAATAGLQQYDVITQIDGQNASSKIGEFLDSVRAFNPNETHSFSLLRGGQATQASIVVGTRPDDFSTLKYQYETPMEDLSDGKVFGRGGMLEKDDQGNWVFKGFNMKDVPNFFHAMPDVGDVDFNFNMAIPGPGGHQVFVYKDQGQTFKINREEGGKITVTRTETADGKSDSTTTTYESEEDLKARDAEAYEALQNCPAMIDLENLPGGMPHGLGLFAPGAAGKGGNQWQDAMKHHEKAMKFFHAGDAPGAVFNVRKARTSFETTPDGRIRVTVRQGEDELIENYNNADELKAAKPDLFKKYEKFQRHTEAKGSAR